jgi:tetratricopeptide (TPR) repeat protein
MLWGKKYCIIIVSLLYSSIVPAQHPNLRKIDSLEDILPGTRGIERINCLNALGEEYWWPVKIDCDSIENWATLAHRASVAINYKLGKATAMMLLGVAEVFRKNPIIAENDLRQSLVIFETIRSDFGMGWGNMWLGQAMYLQNNFHEALVCYERSVSFLKNKNDWEGEGKAWAWIGIIYATLGNYDSSFYYCSKSLVLRQEMSDYECVTLSYINMGQLYQAAGSYADALNYYNEGFRYANTHKVDRYAINWAYLEPVGVVYRLMNLSDSSYYYLQKSLSNDSVNRMTRISFAETLMTKNQYDSALNIFLAPIDNFRKGNDKWDLMRVLMDASKAYLKKGNTIPALSYALETSTIATQSGAKQFIVEGDLLLSKLYNKLHINDSAYFFLQKYMILKDSIVNNQFRWKLSNYKEQEDFIAQTNKLALLDRENKTEQDKLQQQTLLKWILICCMLILALSGVVLYKNLTLKRKNEKLESQGKQSALQQHITELEMQALRAQMNPHFIFNCLSSINRFILKNETEAASNYLTKFSRLIRTVLTNSKRPFINLEDELEMLCLYLDMEKLRFKDSFDYSIIFTNSIDAGNVFVPPLLLQPFVENAIWHGLMHKEEKGHLEIELSIDKKDLTCIITDNGIGRSKAAQIRSKSAEKQKSMGLKITTERLAFLNKDQDKKTFFNIEDIIDMEGKPAGTRVVLKMNYRDLTEVTSDE